MRKACTASVCSRAGEDASFSTSATARISVTAPVSLLTIIRETRTVSGRRASRTWAGEMTPVPSGFRRVTSKPRLSSRSRLRRTASCSTRELMTCLPLRFMLSAPESRAQLSLSEPQEVKTTSAGDLAPRASATCERQASSSFRASRPLAWVEEGLPYTSVMAWRAASAASGQTRVVAALSR